jgi:hypothetical protein
VWIFAPLCPASKQRRPNAPSDDGIGAKRNAARRIYGEKGKTLLFLKKKKQKDFYFLRRFENPGLGRIVKSKQ